MKRYSVFLISFLVTYPLFSCGICSINSNEFSQFDRFSFSFRQQHSFMEGRTYSDQKDLWGGMSSPIMHIVTGNDIEKKQNEIVYQKDVRKTYEFSVHLPLHSRWTVDATLYFSDYSIYQSEELLRNSVGIGDLFIMPAFLLVKPKQERLIKQQVTLNLGANIPTGSFQKRSIVGINRKFVANELVGNPIYGWDPHIQAGTGALGVQAGVALMARMKQVGVSGSFQGRYNFTNSLTYQFSKGFRIKSDLYYVFGQRNVSIIPSCGILLETSGRDRYEGVYDINTGGDRMFLNYEVQLLFRNLSTVLVYNPVVYENSYGLQLSNSNRVSVKLNYYLKNKKNV